MEQNTGDVGMEQSSSDLQMEQNNGSLQMEQNNGGLKMEQSNGGLQMEQNNGGLQMEQNNGEPPIGDLQTHDSGFLPTDGLVNSQNIDPNIPLRQRHNGMCVTSNSPHSFVLPPPFFPAGSDDVDHMADSSGSSPHATKARRTCATNAAMKVAAWVAGGRRGKRGISEVH